MPNPQPTQPQINVFYKKLKNVSCEYDRENGWNSTLQAAWYIRHLHKVSFARVLCFILMKDIGRWLPWMLPAFICLLWNEHTEHQHHIGAPRSPRVAGHIYLTLCPVFFSVLHQSETNNHRIPHRGTSRVSRVYQTLLGWKTYKYYHETDELPNPRPTQPKKK